MIKFQTDDPRINDKTNLDADLIIENTWNHLQPEELHASGRNSFLVLARAALKGNLEQCDLSTFDENNSINQNSYDTWYNYFTRTSALERSILQQSGPSVDNLGRQSTVESHAVRIPNSLKTDRYDFIKKLKGYSCEQSSSSSITPYRISDLQIKGLQDDFYLNLIHWGKSGSIAAATGQKVKIIRSVEGCPEVFEECDQFTMGNSRASIVSNDSVEKNDSTTRLNLDGNLNSSGIIASEESPDVGRSARNPLEGINRTDQGAELSSLTWHPDGHFLTVGRKNGVIQAWDIEKKMCLRHIASAQSHRIGAMNWSGTDNNSRDHETPLLACGSRDKSVTVHDLRQKVSIVEKWECHRQEVCGIKWNYHSPRLLASGGNDNKVYIWKIGYTKPLATLASHVAAVKAIAWHPVNRNILVTGGGTNDRQIRVWNVAQELAIDNTDAEGQVCNIDWNKNGTKIISSQGYSRNDLALWSYPKLEPRATLRGHRSRVLYMALCPDKEFAVSGSGDENVRIWRVFDKSDAVDTNERTDAIFST